MIGDLTGTMTGDICVIILVICIGVAFAFHFIGD